MKASREPKRLFVGGLGHSVSEADLQQQFSRFGEVSDVEIITRKDDQGNPQKVFAYINIQVAEADLKKCMSVLNKTKWKGGTLQIQLAKESFLHRLAQEREEAKAKKEESARGNSSLLEKRASMDFQGKGVPGTEVPGHKNWVVSKFGRVLPILHLKNQQKRKIIKYDPSKYCHNLKKIGEDFTNTVPVSNLTWEMEGGDDPMSKKRRGEFSDFHSPPRKMIKTQKIDKSNGFTALRPQPSLLTKSSHFVQQKTTQKTLHDSVTSPSPQVSCSNNTQKNPKNLYLVNSGLEMPANRNSMSDDTDSEDELRLMIAREENLTRTMKSYANESENDSFEVVKDDFKSDIQNLGSFTDLGVRNDNGKASDCGYDSGDTDEIITMKKTAGKVKSDKKVSQRECFQRKNFSKECELSDHHNKKTTPKKTTTTPVRKDHEKRNNSIAQALSQGVKLPACESPSNCSGSDVTDSKSESETSAGEEEYNAMMKNCLRVNLTLADLQEMAGRDSETPREGAQGNGQETTTARNRPSKGPKAPSGGRRGQRCVNPEEIVASLLEEESSYAVQKPKENNFKPKFQAFKGIGCLYEKHSENKSLKESVATNSSINKESLKLEGPSDIPLERVSSSASGSQSGVAPFQQTKKANDPDHTRPLKRQSMSQSQDLKTVSTSCSVKGTDSPAAGPQANRKSLSSGAKTPRPDFDKGCCQRTAEIGGHTEKTHCLNNGTAPERSPVRSCKRDAQESKTDPLPCATRSPDVSATHKQADDNQKRLAALEARQRAKEAQKKLVHDALANLDGPAEAKPSHIIFGSDSESEVAEAPSPPKQTHSGEEPAKKALGKTSGKLFDSSADEESASEDDEERFRIKPQFEGRAGQKLMNLQSHFGTDERFRLDSRFLESESEEEQEVNEGKSAEDEELAAEKLKTLNVMQSVLQISLNNATSKSSATAKKFKDVIRYDPTRQDHATYERKTEDKPKESKAKRKKKREEAEKLPEVSKEMYYNVAKDLKEIFQSTRDISEKEEISPCTEGADGESAKEGPDPAALTGKMEQSTGFTFSFFDSDTEEVKKDTYRIETVKPGKLGWQGASRFQDSSSSEEEDGTEDAEDEKPSAVETSVPEKETTRFFFFSKTDERLRGSDLFWRGVGNDISQSSWEARTRSLHMDCRKKHKDAKRRVKTK
ncbi:nucleolar protein 8 isoform X2 [Sorex araneus]|uniref:nucleolar protein 8 isoform X2 n=1 Tax=Sorex araneus TaxID=42254 RepID=UPI0024337C2B|nr:nucleolar protein 8 isoform X2 [Sorex araneus]